MAAITKPHRFASRAQDEVLRCYWCDEAGNHKIHINGMRGKVATLAPSEMSPVYEETQEQQLYNSQAELAPLPSKAEAVDLFDGVLAIMWQEQNYPFSQKLTARERETLYYYVIRGLSNTEVAEEMVISIKTVEAHRSHIRTKLAHLMGYDKLTGRRVMHFFTAKFWKQVGERTALRQIEELMGDKLPADVVRSLYDRHSSGY